MKIQKLGESNQMLPKCLDVGFEKKNTLCCFIPDTNQLWYVLESRASRRVCGYQGVSTPCWFGLPDRDI